MRIKACSACKTYSEEWMQYPYWGFIKMKLYSERSKATDSLRSALIYSNAYIDDNDNVIIYTDTAAAAVCINNEIDTVLQTMSRYDEVEHNSAEVFVADDL